MQRAKLKHTLQHTKEEIRSIQNKLQLKFKRPSLLSLALTHPSYSHEHGGEDNQRLEYLGDSVLGLIVNEYLYDSYPDLPEGKLARIKSQIVSRDSLARIAKRIKIGDFLILGKGELSTHGEQRPSSLADALEAIFAAVYLDKGLDAARDFILPLFEKRIQLVRSQGPAQDAKSSLQEFLQGKFQSLPSYDLIKESGPDHKKTYEVRVMFKGKEIARGKGATKKKAEQVAASSALRIVQKKEA